MSALFYVFGLLCIYSYFLYPLVLIILPARVSKTSDANTDINSALPTMCLIVTVHNEEARIRDKLDNTLAIDYPSNLLEIIVASDFSTDETDTIVQSYEQRGIRLVRTDARKGKEYAQLCAIRESKGEILVFSDVATQIPPEALKKLASKFTDSRVGAVSSTDRFISNDGSIVGEGAYVKYEMWLRSLESDHAGLVGLSGSFFAARRSVCESWDIESPSDFNTALNSARQGKAAIICPEVIGIYKDVSDASLEYRRKVRTVIRGLTAISRHTEVLNPLSMGFFAFQVWSHKIMRWGVPWFMIVFLVLSFYLGGHGIIFALALQAQGVFYALALIGWFVKPMQQFLPIKLIFFFVQTNIAIAQATIVFFMGKRMNVWTPSQRW